MEEQAALQIMSLQSASTLPTKQVLTGKYRRNGKLQSCEPCRKSKLKCDHTIPTCGRCIKRRCVDQCIYHPNPLSQQTRQAPNRQTPNRQTPKRVFPTPSVSSNHNSPQSIVSSVEAQALGPSVIHNTGNFLQYSNEPVVQVHRSASAPPLRQEAESIVLKNSEFLGATSYTSIFRENLYNLGVVTTDLDSSEIKNAPIGADRIEQGCSILRALSKRTMNAFLGRWFEVAEGLGGTSVEPIIKGWLRKFMIMHGDTLEVPNPDKIVRLCELLWRNTRTPITFNGNTTATEWIELGTGSNVRWEVIGLWATLCGLAALCLESSDSIFKEHNVTRDSLTSQMSEISATCLRFCHESEAHDDMFIWLLTENVSFTAAVKGQSSHFTYQMSGELVNAIFATGLHQVIEANDRVPFFLAEIRKSLLVNTYCNEISLASFLGRPPRISHRYCNLQPPLDLTDSQYLLGKDEMQKAIASLDQSGFSKHSLMCRNTWSRAWLPFAIAREDILDLALANNYTQEDITRRAADIEKNSEENWEKLPEFIRKAKHEDISKSEPAIKTLFLAIFRQGYRANELLLQRVLIRKTGTRPEKLIHTARAIFKDVLDLHQRQDLMSNYQLDLTAHLVVHGLRSSAILAVELSKQEQLLEYPKEPLLPRSQTIRDLSVFASRLEAVHPSNGMFSVCQQGYKVITRILDKILAPPKPNAAPVYAPRHSNSIQSDQPRFGDTEVDVMGNEVLHTDSSYMTEPLAYDMTFGARDPILVHDTDFMFMQWLDNVDWDRPWISVP